MCDLLCQNILPRGRGKRCHYYTKPWAIAAYSIGSAPAPLARRQCLCHANLQQPWLLRIQYNVSGPTQYMTSTLNVATGLLSIDDFIGLFWRRICIEGFRMKWCQCRHLILNFLWCAHQCAKRAQVMVVHGPATKTEQTDRLRGLFCCLVTKIGTGKMSSQAKFYTCRGQILCGLRE